ncbi:MAG: hypothetical protein IKN54_06180 [Lachnospiraceae bacterium]|nr:hypothetical protein [Lachnospiraceae bacterium]
MDIKTARIIIGDSDLTDDEVSVLLNRAKKLAKNHYFWHPSDNPSDEELNAFYERYEYEIYDVAREVYSAAARDGLKQFTELGVTRVWGLTGQESVNQVLAANIIPKTYTM